MKKIVIVVSLFICANIFAQNYNLNETDRNEKILNITKGMDAESFSSFIKDLDSTKKNLKYSAEYIRTDKNEKQILCRKLNFPLESYSKVSFSGKEISYKGIVYYGEFNIPFNVYNEKINKQVGNSTIISSMNYKIMIYVFPRITNNKEEKTTVSVHYTIENVYIGSCTILPKIAGLKDFKIPLNLGPAKAVFKKGDINLSVQDDFLEYIKEYVIVKLEE